MKNNTLLPWIMAFIIIQACSGVQGNGSSNAASEGNSEPTTGNDLYFEFQISTTMKMTSLKASRKIYYSAEGKIRIEMSNPGGLGDTNNETVVSIGSLDKPNESIMIDNSAKTYSIVQIPIESLSNPIKMESSVSKVGEEKILGFNCIHAQIISHKILGNVINNTDTLDFWRSNELPYPEILKMNIKKLESKSGYLYSASAANQLKQMGCDGPMVKMEMRASGIYTKDELVKVEHKTLAKALFEIPAGYTENKNAPGF